MIKSLRDPQFRSQPDHDPYIQDFFRWSKSPDTFRQGCGGSEDEEEREYIPLEKLREKLNRRRVEGILAALFDKGDRSPPDVDVVISHYLRPFAILLRIGEGSMIYQFVTFGSLQDDRLPFSQEPSEFPSSTRGDIWADFRREQWAFCALTLEYSRISYIGPDVILPINHKEKIDEGGSSITYKIIIDRDYDKLVPLELADSHGQHRNTYVLKTYQTAEAQTYFDTEEDAFRRLKDDGMPPSNIIGFYGGFVCEETYNIILEYADLGNLDDYMERIPPPSTLHEKMTFWDNFLSVMNGLVKIHGEGEDDPDIFQILLGWHQDVNPFNILVKSRGAGNYDCDFKLADLGLSHFERHLSDLRNVSTQEKFGTSAYAAPEVRRFGEKLQKYTLKIKRSVDIWSLSCVFSEVATWVNKGWDQLAEYRNRRIQEMEQRTGKREDCFHDGLVVLNAVEQSHDEIASRCANDPITFEVVDSIIRDMLLFKEAQRPEAFFMYHKSRRIIEEVKANTRYDESPALATTYGVHPRPTDMKKRPLKDPPNLPPNHERNRSGVSALVQRLYAGPKVWAPERSPYSGDNGPVSGDSWRDSRQSHVYSDYHDETYDQDISNAPNSPPRQPASGHLGRNQTMSTPGPRLGGHENRKVRKPLPELSVAEGLDLKRRGHQFPREMELEARDHAFLIDNAESMKPYRDEVEKVLELLWAMVEKHDPDGADLYITSDMQALKPKTDSRALQELRSRPAKYAPDMRYCFAQIIEKYQSKFGKRNIGSKLLHPKATPAKGPRKLSLYVLTDGVWQTKTDLKQVIRTLVDHLIQHKLTNKQIGIQFIRFGNDERGMKRLEKLDSGLDLALDIIDTTPANGSVWKMLLGAVNDTFDDDPDDEENENENEIPHEYRSNKTALAGKGKAKDPWR